MNFGTLFDGLGCFPFDHGAYPPQSDSQASLDGIRSLIILSTLYQGHRIFSALPPILFLTRLALKLFRGEPAISKFDWNFTPSHSSSAIISTSVGSVLHVVLPTLQPGHG